MTGSSDGKTHPVEKSKSQLLTRKYRWKAGRLDRSRSVMRKFVILWFKMQSRQHWCLLCPADSWLGNGNCCVLWKDFPMKTEKDVRPREARQRELLMEPVQSESTAGHEGALVWCREAMGTLLPSGEHWGRSWLPTVGAGRSSEVSPPHNVTNPSGMTSLHTPTHPLPSTILDNWVKTPAWAPPQARTETPTPPVTASRPITSHLCCSASSLFFSGFGLPLLILCLQDSYQGLAQTYATCHPAFHGHAAWSQAQSEAPSGEALWHITNSVLLYWWKELSNWFKISMSLKKERSAFIIMLKMLLFIWNFITFIYIGFFPHHFS